MAKKVLVPALLTCCLSVLAGCQGFAADKASDEFPDFLVGTWKADGKRWQITFQPGGSISSFNHQHISVPVEVERGGVYEPLRKGAFAVYSLGPCDAEYNPRTRELSVRIVIDDFYMEFPLETHEGTMSDYFTGKVSADGRTWQGKWDSRIEIPTIGPTDPNEIITKPIIFQKID